MAGNSPGKINFAPQARILLADASALIPADLPEDVTTVIKTTGVGAKFKELGYTSADGIELTPKVETDPIEVHQSAVPVKYVVKSASAQLKFTMMQWDMDTVEFYFGNSWVQIDDTDPTLGYRLDLDSTPNLEEKCLVLEWGTYTEVVDGVDATLLVVTGTKSRLVISRGMVSDKDALKLTRTDAQQLGVTFDALDNGAGKLGYVLTNEQFVA